MTEIWIDQFPGATGKIEVGVLEPPTPWGYTFQQGT